MFMYLRKDWIYIDLRKYLYLDLENSFKEMKKLKGVFKPLSVRFNYGKNWYPVLWCSKPAWIHIVTHSVEWKDKFSTPRYEVPPYIWIHLFGFNLVWYWDLPSSLNGNYILDYWEQALWYLYYASYNKEKKGYDELDIDKARRTFPWQDMNGNSTWIDKFLIK